MLKEKLKKLEKSLSGQLIFDELHRKIYATDASVFRKLPLAICYPSNSEDIKELIRFAHLHSITLTARAAGTSLAGQCVSEGIVVDVSKHMHHILAFDEKNRSITVQPGVIRDELNLFLKPYNLFFGPNTSTSNRCMIGGMVGNNSSGTTSIQYGVTRDKVTSIKGVLSDGTTFLFKETDKAAFKKNINVHTLEGKIHGLLWNELSKKEVRTNIEKEFPKRTIHRRNTGYAVDTLIESDLFNEQGPKVNLSKLLCGSEGTLAFMTEITILLDPLPPEHACVIAGHFHSVEESLKAVNPAMTHNLYMCELMDKTILDCTLNNRTQLKNRFFINGDPHAILLMEVRSDSIEQTKEMAEELIISLKKENLGYAYPKLFSSDIDKAINLRNAGLGLLGNIIGDAKAVACIEDTAVALPDLPAYISEFTDMMNRYNQKAVYYAHAGAGELHLRPILNLKKSKDVQLFRKITEEVAHLVKKYGGSLSGEHGDGMLRAEFIPLMIGEENYELLKKIKQTFDPTNIFNRGKIVDPYEMVSSLRYETDKIAEEINTIQDFSEEQGILRIAEKCNGSGDCRKPVSAGGTMCPSYRATKDEKDTTRARANALREYLTNSEKLNKFNHKELYDVFDLCLSCKACSSECPSTVDVAALKAEFLHQYYKSNPPSLRTKLLANNISISNKVRSFAFFYNLFVNTSLVKNLFGIAAKRNLPKLRRNSLRNWYKKNYKQISGENNKNGQLYLFCDEFTDNYDVQTGIDCIELLTKLNYKVLLVNHVESGRSHISKGFLHKAKELVDKNIAVFKPFINQQNRLVGIEPSSILGFRDEFPRLAADKDSARKIAENCFTIDEFIRDEYLKGNIKSSSFETTKKIIKIHAHCHQKSLSSTLATWTILNIPANFKPSIMNTGCCGMAGAFGYEKEHFNLSMQIGETSLFPKIRNYKEDIIIAASGTSCRHQIHDGTKRQSKHPVSILKEALI